MAVSLTITDNADGSGATATVTGAAGETVSVFAAKARGYTGPLTFGVSASRVGDGAVSLPLAHGLYFAYWTVNGVVGGTYYFSATDGTLAVATRCRRAVCDTIRLLTIPPASRVYEQMLPDNKNVSYPCILVTVDGVQETTETGLSTRDDIGRPVKVMIADRSPGDDVSKLHEYEYWRQSIDRCFRNQQLAGVPESKICTIEPYVIIDPNLPQFEYMVSGLVVRCVCREPRGVGV